MTDKPLKKTDLMTEAEHDAYHAEKMKKKKAARDKILSTKTEEMGLHAGAEVMLDFGHFGDEIGDLNEFVLGIAAGDNDMLVVRLAGEYFDHFLNGQIVVA